MSRLEVTNARDFATITHRLRANASESGHRGLLVCHCTSVKFILDFLTFHSITALNCRTAVDRADEISLILGSEHECLAIAFEASIDNAMLAASAGTIVAGGILILILTADATQPATNTSQRFIRLLRSRAVQSPGLICEIDCHFTHLPQAEVFEPNAGQALLMNPSTGPSTQWRRSVLNIATAEQDALLSDAINHQQQCTKSCLIIIGSRGRGKSRLLTRLANYLHDKNELFRITAHHRSALTVYEKHRNHINSKFVTVADALGNSAKILLVEEAGSFSIDQLNRFMQQYEQLVLCTTLDGYEIAGRAFANRFLPTLKSAQVPHLILQPKNSWRWASPDPLEELMDRLLLNHDSDKAGRRTGARMLDGHHISESTQPRILTQTELAGDETWLQGVYQLLRDSHYQSSAKDISHLLDAPGLLIAVQACKREVLAAIMVVLEGALEQSLQEAIVSKTRRIAHQLLPQLLAQCANNGQLIEHRFARVVRIAVAENCRRQGLGSSLLDYTEKHLLNHTTALSAIGASFAGDPVNKAFWKSQHYQQFHTGFKNNPRTGVPSVAYIKPLDSSVADALRTAVLIHQDNQRARELISNGSAHQSAKTVQSLSIASIDEQLLKRFVDGQRSLHDTAGAISRLALQTDFSIAKDPAQKQNAYEKRLRLHIAQIIGS